MTTQRGGGRASDQVPASDLNLPFEFRTLRMAMHITLLVPLAAASIFILAGFAGDKLRSYGPGFVTIAFAAAVVTMLPWPITAWGIRLSYAWLAVDVLLITVGWAPGGSGLLFLYALTTAFFAICFPLRVQVFLFVSTVASYGVVRGITRSDLLPFVTLAILGYLANFLSRELRAQTSASRQAHYESERRWTLAATVSAAARNINAADPQVVLTAVVDSIVRLGYESARIYVRRGQAGSWEILLPGGLSGQSTPEGQSLPATLHRIVLGEGRTLIVRRGDPDLAGTEALDELHLQTMVAMPILAHDGTEAVIIVGSNDDSWEPSLQDLEVFQMLAAQAGVALENARSFEEQQRAVERMAELDRLKSDFLSTVSHELRTPLTVVSGMGLTLERQWEALDDEVRLELLARLNANAQTLEGIITRLLDFSRIEAGRLDVQAEEVDLGMLIERLVRRLEALTSNHHLSVDVGEGLRVRVDPVLLERVFENLLSNAVKYTPTGSHIRVTGHSDGEEAVLAVRDDGPGISEDELPHLGERFFRGGDPQTRTTRGTGLGLSLVSEILRLHGSKLDIRSRLGEGATFSFRLPSVTGEMEKEPKAGEHEQRKPSDPMFVPESMQGSDWNEDVIRGERFETVLAAAQMGTEWAVAALHHELNPRILRYLKALGVGSPTVVASRVWEELAANLGTFDGDLRSLRRWVFALARAEAFDPGHHESPRDQQAPPAESALDLASVEMEDRSTVGESLAQISALPRDQAEVMLLRILGDLTPIEVSEILGMRPATVRNLEQQGLERLRMATALASLERAMEGS